MNPNFDTRSTGPRLQRIKSISRVVRFAILAGMILNLGNWLYWFLFLPKFTPHYTLVGLPAEMLLCFWYWKLAGLFHWYERGLIFAAETIRCIKTLGLLCVAKWLLTSIVNASVPSVPALQLPVHVPPGAGIQGGKIAEVSRLHMDFFSFSYGSISIGMLLAGTIIILIAWITDEGRKIQEEKELTI